MLEEVGICLFCSLDAFYKSTLCKINMFLMVDMISFCIRLCQECQTLIENHSKIKLLSNVRNNLNTTLKVYELCSYEFSIFGSQREGDCAWLELFASCKNDN
ncbi:hypothetical protein RchiOBHm_Chr2g0113821 [Rosa chinensis]|uniref:Uncharacterized protein n=1 Tax=Rosa chinensis TaxID=74649 RepID=A0A2P6RQK7_ROSCH|nr:hypothetical protein RchiOBHm_Chr2g0113821 [Rosa chinensis]